MNVDYLALSADELITLHVVLVAVALSGGRILADAGWYAS
jgi:hypothetical protein